MFKKLKLKKDIQVLMFRVLQNQNQETNFIWANIFHLNIQNLKRKLTTMLECICNTWIRFFFCYLFLFFSFLFCFFVFRTLQKKIFNLFKVFDLPDPDLKNLPDPDLKNLPAKTQVHFLMLPISILIILIFHNY